MIFGLVLMICMVVFGHFLGISDLYVCKFIRSVTDVSINFWCYKGKQVASRQGSFWSTPRLTVTGVDLWPLLLDQLQHISTMPQNAFR